MLGPAAVRALFVSMVLAACGGGGAQHPTEGECHAIAAGTPMTDVERAFGQPTSCMDGPAPGIPAPPPSAPPVASTCSYDGVSCNDVSGPGPVGACVVELDAGRRVVAIRGEYHLCSH